MDTLFEDVDFTVDSVIEISEGVEFLNCNFNGMNLSSKKFKRCKFVECKFVNCNFSNCSFEFSSMRDISFVDCKMVGINWTRLIGINDLSFENCLLDYNVFNGLTLHSLNISNSSLKNADLSGGNFAKSKIINTNLESTTFNKSSLEGCDLSGSQKYYIDLKSTKLMNATFSFPEALSLLQVQGIKIL